MYDIKSSTYSVSDDVISKDLPGRVGEYHDWETVSQSRSFLVTVFPSHDIGDEIVVENLITFGEVTDGKEQLTALAQTVCDSYEENL